MLIPNSWRNCITAILQRPSSVLVIGEGTSGKTSFVTALAQEGFRQGLKVAVLDMDIGQSNIGPPTTMGLGYIKTDFHFLSEIPAAHIYFVGHTSPIGKEIIFAEGLKNLIPRIEKVDLAVVESVAFFKDLDFRNKMLAFETEIIRPYYIVVLKEHTLYQEKKTPEGGIVFSLPALVRRIKRNLGQRKRFRVESWKRYLREGRTYSAIIPDNKSYSPSEVIGLPVGITDNKGNHLAVGIVYNATDSSFSIFAPPLVKKGVGSRTSRIGPPRFSVIMGEVKVEGKVLNFIKAQVKEP